MKKIIGKRMMKSLKHKLQNRVKWRIDTKIVNELNQLRLRDLDYEDEVRHLRYTLLKQMINEINNK